MMKLVWLKLYVQYSNGTFSIWTRSFSSICSFFSLKNFQVKRIYPGYEFILFYYLTSAVCVYYHYYSKSTAKNDDNNRLPKQEEIYDKIRFYLFLVYTS